MGMRLTRTVWFLLLSALSLPTTAFAGPSLQPQSARSSDIYPQTECSREALPRDGGLKLPGSRRTSSAELFVLSARAAEETCSAASFAALPPSELVSFVKRSSINCISSLFRYSAESSLVYTTSAMSVMLSEIVSVAPIYSAGNSYGLENMLEFVRGGYFLKASRPDLPIDSAALSPHLVHALTLVSQSPAFLDVADDTGYLAAWIKIVDNEGLWVTFAPSLEQLLLLFWEMPARLDSYPQGDALYSVLYTLARASYNSVFLESSANFVSLLDLYASDTVRFASPNNAWVAQNAIFTLGTFRYISDYLAVSRITQQSLAALVRAYDAQPQLTGAWLQSLSAIVRNQPNECAVLNDGREICKGPIAEQLKATLLRDRYEFDDGRLVVLTSLPLNVVQKLYHAAKEVEAQFFRILGTREPVPGDPSHILTIWLYDTRSNYEIYQPFLTGLGTSNGGIYIEQDARFYTYERTPEESRYTLEELFRHEYTHYLQARYLAHGFWGESPIYSNERLTWYEEGMAEFLAGSTRAKGVLPRRVLIQQLGDESGWYSVPQVLTATYGSFDFYRYSGLLFNHLYESDVPLLRSLFHKVRTNDVAGFDALITSLKSDSVLANSYRTYLRTLQQQASAHSNPEVFLRSLIRLSTGEVASVEQAFDAVVPVSCAGKYQSINRRFECFGSLPSFAPGDWSARSRYLDEVQSALAQGEVENLKSITCTFNEDDTFACEGPLVASDPADSCQSDLLKVVPGVCGCGVLESRSTSTGKSECLSASKPRPPKISKTSANSVMVEFPSAVKTTGVNSRRKRTFGRKRKVSIVQKLSFGKKLTVKGLRPGKYEMSYSIPVGDDEIFSSAASFRIRRPKPAAE
jgi:microbial collagenase